LGHRFNGVSIFGGLAVAGYLATCLFAAIHPTIVNVGYQPKQPVPFSHRVHAGQLKMDCRYCHNTVEVTGHAAIPATATCGNCHGGDRVIEGVSLSVIQPESRLLDRFVKVWKLVTRSSGFECMTFLTLFISTMRPISIGASVA
jgi:hypothetical protein